MTIRVLVVDDHPAFRSGLRFLLGQLEDIEVVGEAENGRRGVELAAELLPDVVLMDLAMPELTGIEATREIVETHPSVRVLVLTMSEDDESVFTALRAGASGYLLKGANEDDIERAVRSLAQGEAIFGASIAKRIIGYFNAPRAQAPAATPFPSLSEREREVLNLVADGKTNPEIARALYLSPKTVRNHVSNIFTKLQVADRAHAIARARDAGLGTPLQP